MKTLIAVIGGESPPAEVLALAEEVGRRIAEAGAAVVCGGLGGVMEAVCRGAHSAGGLTIGILPMGRWSDANSAVDIAIPTGLGVARNVLVVLSGHAVIAIDGSFGTLTEIAHALELRKPVFALASWNLASAGIDPTRYIRVESPQQAVRLALEAARRPPGSQNPFHAPSGREG
ncbi:MAG: TIGR00725 family protein [Thermoplasmata archaeon]|nr:TIGR00725 family protein [Thermoplasmata archaeon]